MARVEPPTTGQYLLGCVAFSLGVKMFVDADRGVDPFHAMIIGVGFVDAAATVVLLLFWVTWNRCLPPFSILSPWLW